MAISAQGVIQEVGGVSCVATTLFGLSTDSKPTIGVGNGTAFIEMDTGKLWFFDAANQTWREWGGE